MTRLFLLSFVALVLSGCQTRTATIGKIIISDAHDVVAVASALKEEFARLGFRPDGVPAPSKDTIAFFSGGNSGDQIYLRMIARERIVTLEFNPRSPAPADEAAAANAAEKIEHFLAAQFPALQYDFTSGRRLYTNPDAML